MSKRMVELDRIFLQAESEVAALNMVYGSAAAGMRVMISTSGPGISLMQEGLSYIAGSEVPVVIVDVMHSGPGLGNIQPSQGDYNHVTKTTGHDDFHPLVLAPATIKEGSMVVFVFHRADGFDLLQHPCGDRSRPKRGVFSLRSPSRPNPIGITEVELLAIEGNILTVLGLDAMNGTPVLNLKPA